MPRPSSPTRTASVPANSISLEALDLLPHLSLRRWMKKRFQLPSGSVRGRKKQVTPPPTFASVKKPSATGTDSGTGTGDKAAGEATGEKEETTLASNALTLIPRPLGNDWLGRALRSTSAEPLENATYRQAPLSEKTRAALLGHSQFRQD